MFAKSGKWIAVELSAGLDGCPNKTAYNIKHCYLPELTEFEQVIQHTT